MERRVFVLLPFILAGCVTPNFDRNQRFDWQGLPVGDCMDAANIRRSEIPGGSDYLAAPAGAVVTVKGDSGGGEYRFNFDGQTHELPTRWTDTHPNRILHCKLYPRLPDDPADQNRGRMS